MRATAVVACLSVQVVAVAGCGGETQQDSGGGAGAGGAAQSACVIESSGTLPSLPASDVPIGGPGIVATDSSFVIGYRDRGGASLRARLFSLSDSGSLGAAQVFDLGCAAGGPADSASLAYRDGVGMFTASLPECGTGAGAVFIPFDDQGTPSQASGPKNNSFLSLVTSARAVSPGRTLGEWELVYAVSADGQSSTVERVVLEGATFKSSPPVAHPFGDGHRPWGSIASGREVVALLSPNPATQSLELLMGPLVTGPLNVAPAPPLPPGDSGDLVAWGARAAVGVRSGPSVRVSVFRYSASGGLDSVGEGQLSAVGSVSSALAVDYDRLFVAHGGPGSIQLDRIDGADGVPDFGAVASTKIPADFNGARMAIAAARGKVAMVWLGGAQVGAETSTGGWAIMRCE